MTFFILTSTFLRIRSRYIPNVILSLFPFPRQYYSKYKPNEPHYKAWVWHYIKDTKKKHWFLIPIGRHPSELLAWRAA